MNIFLKIKLVDNENIKTNIYRIHATDSILCEHFCNGFVDFVLKDKSLLDCPNLFSSNEYEKNYKIILF